jgi:acetyl esterase/lipase
LSTFARLTDKETVLAVENIIFDAAKRGTVDRDVIYAVMAGRELAMDVYYPQTRGPWPGLIFIHGGGWSEGDKAPLPVVPPGYLVASINYRLYPDHRFPAMIEDVKCAIRFLRAHAAACNLDPTRIALIGHSAGGHLAALAGLNGPDAGWDVGLYLEQSSQVQAVIEMSGPTDLKCTFPDWVEELKIDVFGADGLAAGSPVTYARRDAPPFLIVHGDADAVVPVEQAHLLHRTLLQAGAFSELIVVQNAGHGFEPVTGPISPLMDQVFNIMLAFLSRMGQK